MWYKMGWEFRSNRRYFSQTEAMRCIVQLLGGLSDVHAAGIMHRDLVCRNVLIKTDKGEIFFKLADFGIAKVRLLRKVT